MEAGGKKGMDTEFFADRETGVRAFHLRIFGYQLTIALKQGYW